MRSPILSICIATYNRAGFIGETLDSILHQLTDEVEIVVVDGASTDATPTVMERYAADCPGLRYVRLPAKGGVDQDYCKAVECARGEYCWLFPDDDLFKPGAVKRVLDELRNGPCLVIVNAEPVGEAEQGVAGRLCPHDEAPRGMVRIAEQECGEEAQDFLLVQIVGVAQGAVHVEAQGFDPVEVEGHGGNCNRI